MVILQIHGNVAIDSCIMNQRLETWNNFPISFNTCQIRPFLNTVEQFPVSFCNG